MDGSPPVAASTATLPLRVQRVLPWIVAVAMGLSWLATQWGLAGATRSDEGIYFYMSARTAAGDAWPYRDYFFAHPPLHLLLSVVWLKLAALTVGGAAGIADPDAWRDGGWALTALRILPRLSGLLSAVLVARALARRGPVAALTGAAVLLLSFPGLLFSYTFTGAAETIVFLALGIERAGAGRDRQAGVALAAAGLVAPYGAPVGVALVAVLGLVDRRRAVRVVAVTAAILVVVHGLGAALAGPGYLDGVLRYHLHKPAAPGSFADGVGRLLRHGALVMVAPAAAAAVLAFTAWQAAAERPATKGRKGARDPNVRLAMPAPWWSWPSAHMALVGVTGFALTMVVLAWSGNVFLYYFHVAVLCAALCAGVWAQAAFDLGAEIVRALRARAPIPRSTVRRGLVLVALVGVAPLAERTTLARAAGGAGESTTALAPVRFRAAARAGFDVPARAADLIRSHTPAGGTIFGDSTVAPMTALCAGRRLAFDEADSNPQRFAAAMPSWEAMRARLDAEPPAALVFWVSDPVLQMAERDGFTRAYRPIERLTGSDGQAYWVLVRR